MDHDFYFYKKILKIKRTSPRRISPEFNGSNFFFKKINSTYNPDSSLPKSVPGKLAIKRVYDPSGEMKRNNFRYI